MALSGESIAGLKEELDEVRQIVDSLVCDVLALKVQLCEPKVALVEPKHELETKKLHIVIDSTALVPSVQVRPPLRSPAASAYFLALPPPLVLLPPNRRARVRGWDRERGRGREKER